MINIATARKREEGEKGFTLIELLVVVLIIGVLSAIAIPAFLGQQDQAKDAAAQSDLRNAKTAVMSYAAANSGVYSVPSVTDMKKYGYTQSDGASAAVVNLGSAGVFCIEVTSASTKKFGITESSGAKAGTCSATGVFTAG